MLYSIQSFQQGLRSDLKKVDSTEPNQKLVEDFDGELEKVTVTEDDPTEIDESTDITEEIEITIPDLDAVVTVNPNID